MSLAVFDGVRLERDGVTTATQSTAGGHLAYGNVHTDLAGLAYGLAVSS